MRSIEEIKNKAWKDRKDIPAIDTGSVLNAVAEQLGQDGETKDGVTTWASGDRTVTLTEGDSGCTLEIK